jgi:NIMA (never in mitosis gene a)-related kinase
MASLSSPYVVRYFDSFNDEGALGIVMELCSGGDLQRALKARAGGPPLAEAEVWRTFLHILLGVAYLHSRRTLHRDLKTANVFLTGGSGAGSVKLGDLGVARVLGSETAFARTCVGTPYYLSPELCQNQPYNEKSDMWACGIILYELLTGAVPFGGNEFAVKAGHVLERGAKLPGEPGGVARRLGAQQ